METVRSSHQLLLLFGLSTLLKLLLLAPGLYHSTDFEDYMLTGWLLLDNGSMACITTIPGYVYTSGHNGHHPEKVHRNWLAVTHSLPLEAWYWEDTSEWTLDYPPLFACFQWILSQVAATVEPDLVKIVPHYDPSETAVWFQRISVMVMDLSLVVGLVAWCGAGTAKDARGSVRTDLGTHARSRPSLVTVGALVVVNSGLIMVDNIHFQYNGFLLGLLLLSMGLVKHDRVLLGGATFSCLLMLKHLFLALAPLFFVYLLRGYCCCRSPDLASVEIDPRSDPQTDPRFDPQRDPRNDSRNDPRDEDIKRGGVMGSSRLLGLERLSLEKVAALGGVVVGVFGVVLGPLCFSDGFSIAGCERQMVQLGRRLFPFGRGLVHAYWAPNAWALYLFADRLLLAVVKVLGVSPAAEAYVGSTTGGLVRSEIMAVLPTVPASVCLLLSLLACWPALARAWNRPTPTVFAWAVVHCSLSSFLVGFHVHEKALLIPAVVSAVLAFESRAGARMYLRLNFLASFSAFPLLPGQELMVLKVLLLGTHLIMAEWLLQQRFPEKRSAACSSSQPASSTSQISTCAMAIKTQPPTTASNATVTNRIDSSPPRHRPRATSSGAGQTYANINIAKTIAEDISPQLSRSTSNDSGALVTMWDWTYLTGACLVFLFGEVLHPWLFGVGGVLGEEVLPFLPLMTHSVYGAVGVVVCWGVSAYGGGSFNQ